MLRMPARCAGSPPLRLLTLCSSPSPGAQTVDRQTPHGRSHGAGPAPPHAPCSSIPIWRSRFLAEPFTYAPGGCPGRGEGRAGRRTSRYAAGSSTDGADALGP